VADISRLYEDDSVNDIIISLDDDQESVMANKVVLCARSPYFAKIFNNNVYNPYEKIQLDSSKNTFVKVLQFLYTVKMEIDSLGMKDILELLKLLEQLEMFDIFKVIKTFVLKKLKDFKYSTEDVLEGAALSEAFRFDEIKEEIFACISLSCSKFSRLPEVKVLSNAFVEKLVSHDGIKEENKVDLFTLVANWMKDNVCEEDFKNRLLANFDIKSFTAEELLTVVRMSCLFSEGDILDIVGEKVSSLQKEFEDICREYGEVYDRCNVAEEAREELMKELSNEKEYVKFVEEKLVPKTTATFLRREFERSPRKDEYV